MADPHHIDRWLRSRATWRNLLLLGAVCLLVNIALLAIGSTFAGSARLLDLQLLYTPAEAQQFLTHIGPAGRARYLWLLLSLDLLYPALYALWLTLALIKAAGGPSRWLWLPLAVATCDWCENLGIASLIFTYQPEGTSPFARFTMVCTLLKWIFAAATGLAIVSERFIRGKAANGCS